MAFSGFQSNFAYKSVDFGCGTLSWASGLGKSNLVSGGWSSFVPVSKGDT